MQPTETRRTPCAVSVDLVCAVLLRGKNAKKSWENATVRGVKVVELGFRVAATARRAKAMRRVRPPLSVLDIGWG